MRRAASTASALSVFALAFFANASSAWADFVTFSATGPGGFSATVTFEVSGGNLIVTLTNNSSMDVTASNQVLSGIWFSLPGSMSTVSAEVASGSVVNGDSAFAAGLLPDVSGEWAYKSGLNMGFGSNSGISSSGMDDIFGGSDLFGNVDLDSPVSPNGINYGITSAGDDPTTGNGGLAGDPLIQNSVVFTLSGWDSDWSINDITDVYFQYGTSQSETRLGVPEPGVWVLMGFGLVGLVFAFRRMSWA